MPRRLKTPHIERKPKDVHVIDSFSDPASLAHRPEIARVLTHIRKCIENGSPLPTNYYRKGSTETRDTLLETHGIMHLHLGKPNTSELLYLVQYDDHVVFLELSDHGHLQTSPKGARLVSRHGVAMTRKETDLDSVPRKAAPTRRRVTQPPKPSGKPGRPKPRS